MSEHSKSSKGKKVQTVAQDAAWLAGEKACECDGKCVCEHTQVTSEVA